MDAHLREHSFTPNRAQRRSASRRRVAAVGSAAVLASAAAAVVTGSAGVASAAEHTVSTCADSGVGSLRQAIDDANTNDGPDVITITATCTASGPVVLGSVLDATDYAGGDGLSIVGPGADAFVLDGNGSERIFYVGNGTDFTLSGVTLQHAFGSALRGSGSGDIVVDGVVFDDNVGYQGGGVSLLDPGSVTVTNATFVANSSVDRGGAFYVQNSGPITISSSTFSDNTAVRDGGGILIYSTTSDVEIVNSTFSGNSGSDGGGLYADLYDAVLTLEFCTFADNVATTGAGGGLRVRVADSLTVIGSIFSGNSAYTTGTDEIDVDSLAPTEHDNLFEGSVDGFTPDASDLTGVDPLLGPLADNGGPTQTRALGAGSPAIDAGPTSYPPFTGDTADQRGAPYLRVYGGRADIGAFEVQPEPTPPGPGPTPEPEPEPTFTG